MDDLLPDPHRCSNCGALCPNLPERIPYLPPEDVETLRKMADALDGWQDIHGSGYSSLVAMGKALRAILARLEGK